VAAVKQDGIDRILSLNKIAQDLVDDELFKIQYKPIAN
jgi:hypothetical protein